MDAVSKTAILWAGTVAFMTVVIAYVVLSALKVDTAPFLLFTVGSAGVLLPGLAAWRNTDIIKQQTNGPLTATNQTVATLHESVTQLVGHAQDHDKQLSDLTGQLAEVSERLAKVNV